MPFKNDEIIMPPNLKGALSFGTNIKIIGNLF